MKKIRVRVMTGAECDTLINNDNFTWDDDVVLIVIHDNGKICIDLQTECTRATTIINRLRKAVEGCTDSRITEKIREDIIDWIDSITEGMGYGVYSDASRFFNSETGREEYTGDYSYGVEFTGDDDMPEWYMFLNFLTSEAIDKAIEAAQSAETAQTTENTPDNTNTPIAGAETTTDTITESADSAEREDKTMTDRKTTIGLQALMLTAYERYGSVGMSEYKEMLIDELDIDKDMISDYNEYRIENGYEPYMVYDDLCEQLEGCDPSAIIKMVYFGGMRFNDDFFYFNGYGNISSCTDYEIIKEMEEDKEFLAWYLENSADVEDIDEEEAQEIIDECNKMIAQGY